MAVHFKTVDWAINTNIYEVNIRQYTKEGTFAAFAKHLPRLKDMGVETLWLMPITPISVEKRQGSLGSYYACSSYTTINPEFGSLADFKTLVTQAHILKIKIIIDWVANHTGYNHAWTKEHTDWYEKDEHGNFTEKNGWADVIDLNYKNNELRKGMIEAMQYWINECDIDGFRCDMAHLVPLDFWQEARTQCDSLKTLFWLAECEEVKYHDVFDVTYAWQWMHATEKFVKHEIDINELYNVLHTYSQYPNDAAKLFFTTNHDENSWNGTEYEKYGNLAKALAVFTFTWKGIPLIYSGQELPNNKRLKFFDKDEIEWTESKQPLLHNFYKPLIALHKTEVIATGEIFNLPTSNNCMAYLRKKDEEVVLVILNLSNNDRIKLSLSHSWLQGNFSNVFSELIYSFNVTETFELQAGEYLVYAKK
ncbi:MAG: 1,4-alpha-glucan branching protein [Bacteroidetes bacterium]|nr:1,4-alpha-glucan branching protein [Bacteroidota bacterium]MBS1641513.1 1,4-alpha-glucan branching protein [Bacteroidota bacterium]MBS1671638.1 1,4-alpha-glucan branching protein [Bacteroidota bacterium]